MPRGRSESDAVLGRLFSSVKYRPSSGNRNRLVIWRRATGSRTSMMRALLALVDPPALLPVAAPVLGGGDDLGDDGDLGHAAFGRVADDVRRLAAVLDLADRLHEGAAVSDDRPVGGAEVLFLAGLDRARALHHRGVPRQAGGA